MIYLIATDWEGRACEAYTKIGYSMHSMSLDKRKQSLQIGNHLDLFTVTTFDGTKSDEELLHEVFSEYRVRGEWFKLPVQYLTYAKMAPWFDIWISDCFNEPDAVIRFCGQSCGTLRWVDFKVGSSLGYCRECGAMYDLSDYHRAMSGGWMAMARRQREIAGWYVK